MGFIRIGIVQLIRHFFCFQSVDEENLQVIEIYLFRDGAQFVLQALTQRQAPLFSRVEIYIAIHKNKCQCGAFGVISHRVVQHAHLAIHGTVRRYDDADGILVPKKFIRKPIFGADIL